MDHLVKFVWWSLYWNVDICSYVYIKDLVQMNSQTDQYRRYWNTPKSHLKRLRKNMRPMKPILWACCMESCPKINLNTTTLTTLAPLRTSLTKWKYWQHCAVSQIFITKCHNADTNAVVAIIFFVRWLYQFNSTPIACASSH